MPDITMCLNEDCAKRFECHRFTAVPKVQNQSYAVFNFVEEAGSTSCHDFIDTKYRRG